MKKKKSEINRRDFLSGLGIGGSGLYLSNEKLFESVVEAIYGKLMNTAHGADNAQTLEKNYLLFLHPGAPPRWNCDKFLSPNYKVVNGASNPEFVPHPVVKNVCKSGSQYVSRPGTGTMTYETTSQSYPYKNRDGDSKQIYMPKLWEVTLPRYNNGSIIETGFRMSDMLNNTMIIRGYHLDADFGHVKGPSLQSHPVPSQPSLSGLVADAAAVGDNRRKMPAIALTDSPNRPLGFRANLAKITMASAGGGSNKANDTLSPFLRGDIGNKHSTNKGTMRDAIDQAINKFKETAIARNPNAKSMFNDQSAVNDLVEDLKSSNLEADYTRYKAKYAKIVRYCSLPYPGLIGDVKTRTNGDGELTDVPYINDPYSDKFAIAELFIKNELTASFTFICGGYATPGSFVNISNNPSSAQNDEHNESDRQKSSFCHGWRYRAWMACVHELSKAIGPTKWNNTFMQFGAEYARTPNRETGGSDHSISSCVTTVVSGAINSFIPIGNIVKSSSGTYGVGAATNIEGSGTKRIKIEYVVNTILKMMGIESPYRDKTALVKQENGQWLPATEDPKNV